MIPISIAGVGAIITVIETALRFIGVDFPEGSVASGINGLVAFGGLVLIVYGQMRRKDLKYGILRQ